MPTINIIAVDGFTVAKTTSVSDAQAAQFITLAAAVKKARETLRGNEGQQNVGHVSGAPDEIHPLTTRQLLPRLDAILHRMTVNPISQSDAVRLDRNVGYNPEGGEYVTPAEPSLRSVIDAGGNYIGVARTLGMLLTNENQPYTRAELVGGPTACQLSWR
jgi:hypothetical protein